MNTKGTWTLVALAAALFAYIFALEWPGRDAASQREKASRLFQDFEPLKVTTIEIVRSNQIIRVERTNGLWRLVRPDYPAESPAIDGWLAVAGAVRRRAHLSAGELLADPAAAYGVTDPVATVTVHQGPQRFQFRIGNKTAVGDRLYVQFVGADGIYVTEAALLDYLPVSANQWRDSTFVALEDLPFNRVQVRTVAGEFEVGRDSVRQPWRLVKPRPARVDNALLNQLFQQLQATRIARFINDAPGNDLEPYGLQTPAATMTFLNDSQELLKIEFGKTAPDPSPAVFARRSPYPSIVTVPKTLADLIRGPYSDWLDRSLVHVSPDMVARVDIRAAEAFRLERQPEGTWRVQEPAVFPADPALVVTLFERINALRILSVAKEVVTELDLARYGLAPTPRRYTFLGAAGLEATNPPLAELDFGGTESGATFARRGDENSVYTVKSNEVNDLPQYAFELRDRRVWSFTTNQVTGITITFGERNWQLLRNAEGNWSFAPGSQGIFNPLAVEEALHRLGELRSRAWVGPASGDLTPYGMGKPVNILTIQLGPADAPRTLALEFGHQSPSGGPFAVTPLESGPILFEMPFESFQYYDDVVRTLNDNAGRLP